MRGLKFHKSHKTQLQMTENLNWLIPSSKGKLIVKSGVGNLKFKWLKNGHHICANAVLITNSITALQFEQNSLCNVYI